MLLEVLLVCLVGILTLWYYYYLKSYLTLGKIPAPRVWPLIGNALEVRNPEESMHIFSNLINKLKSKTFRLHMGFTTTLVTADYDLIESVLTNSRLVDKNMYYIIPWLGNGILTSSGEQWRKSRKLVRPAFHYKFLEQFIQLVNDNGQTFIDKMKNQINNQSINMLPSMLRCCLDIILQAALGHTTGEKSIDTSQYSLCTDELTNIMQKRRFTPFYNLDWIYKRTELYQQQQKCIKVVHGYIDAKIEVRRQKLQHRTSTDEGMPFVDMLLRSTLDGRPLTKEELRSEVIIFVSAGHDTVAKTMSCTLFALANNSDLQKKVFDEIHGIFGDDPHRHCTVADLNDMKYLEMVIKESLRMYCPVPLYNRIITENIEYDGTVISPGTSLLILTHTLHMDPDHFKDPEIFDPERFSPDRLDDKKPYKFIPFSAGARNCIGQKFAIAEMKCLLSMILRQLEVKPAIPVHSLQLYSVFGLKFRNGIRLAFNERKYK